MSHTSDYEAIDRYMSSWAVSCVRNGTRFYLTDEGLASDLPRRAAVYRWEDQAMRAAADAKAEKAWRGFAWEPIRTAAIHAVKGTK
jgi:hypothetical protein